MINTINDLIVALEAIKKQAGDINVRTAIQAGHIIEIDYSIEQFWNDSRTFSINVLVFRGYKK